MLTTIGSFDTSKCIVEESVSALGRAKSVKAASGNARACASWFIGPRRPSGRSTLVMTAARDLHEDHGVGVDIGLACDLAGLPRRQRRSGVGGRLRQARGRRQDGERRAPSRAGGPAPSHDVPLRRLVPWVA